MAKKARTRDQLRSKVEVDDRFKRFKRGDRVKIRVTAENVRKGVRNSFTNCPISLALINSGIKGFVASTTVLSELFGGSPIFSLPRSAQRFIKSFDLGKAMKPFTFFITKN